MKSQLSYTKKTDTKVTVKGTLSKDGTFITYLNEDKEDCEISIADCLRDFRGKEISFSTTLTENEDLEIEPSEDEE